MRRAGYEAQESDWIDALCCAMNRWAMASAKVEAETGLWALANARAMGPPALASPPEHSYDSVDADSPGAVMQRQQSIPNLPERSRYVSAQRPL